MVDRAAPPDPEVPATATRRRFMAEYKLRILKEADACTVSGSLGALLRREGLYSSNLTTWRLQRDRGVLSALTPKKRGRKGSGRDPLLAENDKLRKENDRLASRLRQAEIIIDVQKKGITDPGDPPCDSRGRRERLMKAALSLSSEVGMKSACESLNIPRSGFYRAQARGNSPPVESTRRPSPPRALSSDERQGVLDILHADRFADKAPHQVYATLLDEGRYYCSISTMYRILDTNKEVKERRNQLSHPVYQKPELLATAPNQVWSWDITKLLGPAKWSYFYLYVILDIFSRYVVGWMVAPAESAALAEKFIKETCAKQNIERGRLTIHADRGSSMKSKQVAFLLADLGVTKTHSRPHTSDDNPYSESQFKTLKYRPDFPERFGCIEDSRSFCQDFFPWYNTEHRHSGIGLLTPEAVHYGLAEEMQKARGEILRTAYEGHPERFVNKLPVPLSLPEAVWINKPKLGSLV
ncbi:MAG: IS3 family transposase [Nitrospirae bacterium]|nr:IS3 family transposase [Nitrospirota bacterium]